MCERTIVIPNPDPLEVAAITAARPALTALPVTSHQLIAALASPNPTPERLALEKRGWRAEMGEISTLIQ